MKNIMKKLFAPLAIFAMALGVGITLAKERNETVVKAASFTQITDASQIVSGKKYLITSNVYNTQNYRFIAPGNYSAAPGAQTFTDVSLLSESDAWTFTFVTGNGWQITDGTNYLYTTTTNNGLRSNATSTQYWEFGNSASSGYTTGRITAKYLDTNRYLTLYLAQDWRSYPIVYTEGAQQESNLVIYELNEGAPAKVLTNLTSSGTPTKTSYYAGESFDPAGLTFTAHFDDLSTAVVTSFVTFSPNPLTTGTTSVTAEYTIGGVTKTTPIGGLTVATPSFSTAVYELTSKNTLTPSGTAPTGSSATIVETYSTTKQMTSGQSQTLTLTGYNSVRIIEITISMRSNASSGAGNLSYSYDGANFTEIISTNPFSSAEWNGAYSATYVDVVKTVDIVVPSDITLKIAATANSLYAQSYTIKWEEVEVEPLQSLTMNKTDATIYKGLSESFSVTPTPLTSSANVTWSSDTPAIASVNSATGEVTANAVGSAIITATSTENATITASVNITVIEAVYLDKVTSAAQLVYGAEYYIGSETNSKMMSTTFSTYGGEVNATFADSKVLESADYQVFKLVIAKETGAYGFQFVNGDQAGKFLALTANSNNLHTADDLTTDEAQPSWTITFETGDAVITSVSFSGRTIKHNSSATRFATYTSGQAAVQLYMKTSTINHTTAANMFVDEVNNGKGLGALGKCEAINTFLTSAYERLSTEAKAIYNGSAEQNYVDARNRMAFLGAYVASLPTGSGRPAVATKENNIAAIVMLGAFGLTAIVGYYFISKKNNLI